MWLCIENQNVLLAANNVKKYAQAGDVAQWTALA